jgi:putative lipoic acid-binding regulatory protein
MEPEKISFPADAYPIKVVARSELKLRAEVDAVFERHFGALPPGNPAERGSAQGNFMALTYVMRVENVGQLSALNADLQALPGVLFVL